MMNRRQLTVCVGASLFFLSLGACANRIPPEVLQSASYQNGYSDGCLTGNQRTSRAFQKEEVTRNDVLFAKDKDYAIGWRQGFNVCGGSQETNIQKDPEFLTTDRFDHGPI